MRFALWDGDRRFRLRAKSPNTSARKTGGPELREITRFKDGSSFGGANALSIRLWWEDTFVWRRDLHRRFLRANRGDDGPDERHQLVDIWQRRESHIALTIQVMLKQQWTSGTVCLRETFLRSSKGDASSGIRFPLMEP